jgi:DNA-binding CsgD family transcriptional regulator
VDGLTFLLQDPEAISSVSRREPPAGYDALVSQRKSGLRPRSPLGAVRLASGAVVLGFDIESSPLFAGRAGVLTPAQREVVGLVLQGRSDAEIARVRRCSPHTVASHLQSAFRRLGVNSRAELAALVQADVRRRSVPER